MSQDRLLSELKHQLERSAFGVCSYLGQKMGISSVRVRVYFIYATLGALGSTILLYLFLAFWVNIRQYIKNSRLVFWSRFE